MSTTERLPNYKVLARLQEQNIDAINTLQARLNLSKSNNQTETTSNPNVEQIKNIITSSRAQDGKIDLMNIVKGITVYKTIKANAEEIYGALVDCCGGNKFIHFTHPNANPKYIDLSDNTDKSKKIELFRSFLNAASKNFNCTLDLVENKNSKKESSGQVSFNKFLTFAIDKSSIEEGVRRSESFDERRRKIADNIYDIFYSASPENSNSKKEQNLKSKYVVNLYKIEELLKLKSVSLKHNKGWAFHDEDILSKENQNLGRLYFNIEPIQAPFLLNAIIQKILSEKQNNPATFKNWNIKIPDPFEDRNDGCVLYFVDSDQEAVMEIIKMVKSDPSLKLRDAICEGQEKISAGIGFAQDPSPVLDNSGNRIQYDNIDADPSFGEKYSYILAELYLEADLHKLEWSEKGNYLQLKAIYEKTCQKHNVDPNHPAYELNNHNFNIFKKLIERS